MIILNMKTLVRLFFIFLGTVAVFVFYKTYGLSMLFLLAVGLLALKFVPALVLPIVLIAIMVHFTGDFSFMADSIVAILLVIPCSMIAYPVFEQREKMTDSQKEAHRKFYDNMDYVYENILRVLEGETV